MALVEGFYFQDKNVDIPVTEAEKKTMRIKNIECRRCCFSNKGVS